jgi:peptide-methionine (S)-S-oxide reductase
MGVDMSLLITHSLMILVTPWLTIYCVLAVEGCSEKKMVKDINSPREQKNPGQAAPEAGSPSGYEKATFAAGCFWGVEAAFRQVKGVVSTTVGYTGGHLENPTYRDVCSDGTGHAEAVEVIYDPKQVSYEQLLEVFWRIHNPTTDNRQGPDVGSQYRSAIFYHNESQLKAAKASKEKLEHSGRFARPIVTEITPASVFYRAEEYHQRYLEKRGRISCHLPP